MWAWPTTSSWATPALSRIAFWRGDVDDAFQQLTELEYVGHKGRLPRIVACAKLERSRLLLLQGHHQAAREEIDRADDPELWARVERLRYLGNDLTDLAIARWRWGLHAGDALATAEALGHGAQAAQTQARRRRALKLGLLQSAALYRAGASGTALPLLANVLKSACAEGFLRFILDEGAIIAGPLHEFGATADRQRLGLHRPQSSPTTWLACPRPPVRHWRARTRAMRLR